MNNIVIIEYDFDAKVSTQKSITHDSNVAGWNIVFADGLCDSNKRCKWCDSVRRRILSRTCDLPMLSSFKETEIIEQRILELRAGFPVRCKDSKNAT